MASEAQRLIGISLTKIAQSRSHRGGVSLHKNLLVATVLQKARCIFMEEAYNMVHYQPPAPVQARPVPEEELVALTAEDAGLGDDVQESASGDSFELLQPGCSKCHENQNKENQPPVLTYLDLDKSNVLRENGGGGVKRRRTVTDWETEEAVQSILFPKRSKQDEEEEDESDSVFVDEATALSDSVAKEVEAERGSSMEIDRITSLVSIFSFTMGDGGKLNRSVSTPDLCSAQAKDADTLQQRPFLAMTV